MLVRSYTICSDQAIRNSKRKTEKATTALNVMKRAAKLANDNKWSAVLSTGNIAREFKIRYSTLPRFVTKQRKSEQNGLSTTLRNIMWIFKAIDGFYCGARQNLKKLFTRDQAKLCLDLRQKRPKTVLIICAVKHNIRIPPSSPEK
jgi:hypothetical protein